MNIAALSRTVAKYAPLLGSALSSPGGIAIGSIIASVFGSNETKPEKLQNLIITDPKAAIKLRQIESDHQLELRRMIIQAALTSVKKNRRSENIYSMAISAVLIYLIFNTLVYFFVFGVFLLRLL